MFSLRFSARALLLAAAVSVCTASSSQAALFIRVSDGTAGNSVTFGPSTSPLSPSPPAFTIVQGGATFTINNVSLSQTVATANALTHVLNLDFTLSGTISASTRLVVEFFSNNNAMIAGTANLNTNGNLTSTPGTNPNTGQPFGVATNDNTTLTSSFSNSVAALPGTPGALAGFVGTTTGSGGYISGQPSTLAPPVASNSAATSGNVNFYQVFSVGSFTQTGQGTLGATASLTVTPTAVPEPATVVSALVGLGGLGLAKLRRRKAVTA